MRPVVLDPSREMARAAARRGLPVVRATAQAMPLRDRTFRLVWFRLSIHYGDAGRALAEAARVLADDGRIEVWTLGPAHHRTSMLARWFPSVADVDERRFPDPASLVARFEDLGFTVERRRVVEPVRRRVGEWEAAVRGGFVSTLQLLDPEEIRTGLERFREAHPDPGAFVDYELRFDRLVARR